MKTLMLAVVSCACTYFCLAEPPRRPLTEQERRTLVAQRARHAKPNGGLVERSLGEESKVMCLVNSQKVVNDAKIQGILPKVRLASRIPLVLNAKEAPATVELIECDNSPALAIYPEETRAVVNVRSLASDGADEAVVLSRLTKEIVRAALMVVGSGETLSPCYVSHVTSLKELDALNPEFIAPDTLMHLGLMGKLGIHRIRAASYRAACQEGWAPKPDTAERQKIWDEVHELPSEPIRIKFDSKRDGGK